MSNYPIQNKRQCVFESKWQNLPTDVAFLIQAKLLEPVDRICFSGVCKEWLSLSRYYNKEATTGLPLFWKTSDCESKGVVSISSTEKRYGRFLLPVTYGECCGSSHGWLAKVDRVALSLNITLVYPFRKSVAPIRLPPMNFLANTILDYERENFTIKCRDYIKKVILSADPNLHPNDYLVVVLYDSSTKLALFKGGQSMKDWIYLDRRLVHLQDVAFYKDRILVVGWQGRIVSFHVDDDCKKRPKMKRLTSLSPFKNYATNSYLVKSSKGDHLWHVRRLVWNRWEGSNKVSYRERFKVYKVVVVVVVDGVENVQQLEEVDSIGDEALFLGGSRSLSVSASDFPGCCKPNSIYYTNYDTPAASSKHGTPFRIFSFECKNELLPCESIYHTWLPGGFWILPN